MRRLALLALSATLLLASCGGDEKAASAPRSQEDLAKLAFDALRTDAFETLAAGGPTAADLEWTLAKMEENAPEEAAASRASLDRAGGSEQAQARNREHALLAFTKTRGASARFFDWSTAEFVGVDLERTRTKERYGFESADIWFAARAGDQVYDFVLAKCVRTEEGWKTAGGVRFHPSAPGAMGDVKTRMAHAHLASVDSALKMHYVIHRTLPSSLEALLETDPHSGEPFLEKVPNDPWGNPIAYEVLGEKKFQLQSAGPDGERGTDDDLVWPPKSHGGHAPQDD